MNFWQKTVTTLIYSSFRLKATNLTNVIGLALILLGVMGCTNLDTQPTKSPGGTSTSFSFVAPLAVSTEEAPLTKATPPTPQASSTPDLTRIMSPDLASELAIMSPTPRLTPSPVPLQELVAIPPLPQNQLTADSWVAGELTTADNKMLDGTYFDTYEIDAVPGQNITVTLTSNNFDTVLILINSEEEIVAYNDDFRQDDSNSQLSLVVAYPDTYHVIVNSYAIEEGDYRLRLEIADRWEEEKELAIGQPARGWLVPGDRLNEDGLYVDFWTIRVGAEPLIVWARSDEFDPRLDSYDLQGHLLVKNGDLDRIGLDYNSRIYLAPSDETPPGSVVELQVSLQGAFAVGGAYELLALPLPEATDTAVVKVRPIIVEGSDESSSSLVTPALVQSAVDFANEAWQSCGIRIVIETDIQTVSIPEIEGPVNVQTSLNWTHEENALMQHASHAPIDEGIITAYFVGSLDDGRYGNAYPSTRYAPTRSGMVFIADRGMTNENLHGVLAHEIGHILGLNHPDLDDGDPLNDTLDNLMFTSEGIPGYQLQQTYQGLTPLQCITARGTQHFLHTEENEPLLSPPYAREDRVLLSGETKVGSLTTRDDVTEEDEEQFIDVYYFYGQAGEAIVIQLTAAAFEPVLLLEGPSGELINYGVSRNSNLKAEIEIILPETGDYLIGVTSVTRSVGRYFLSFTLQ